MVKYYSLTSGGQILRTDDEDGGVDEVDALEEGLAGRVRVLQLPNLTSGFNCFKSLKKVTGAGWRAGFEIRRRRFEGSR